MSFKLKEFLKAQLSAFLGGMTDLAIYSFCFKVLNFSAPFSNAISGSLGAIVNFVINRYWSFGNTKNSIGSQLWKFVIVVIGSIMLKSIGIHYFVDVWKWHFLLSKLLVEIIVSLGFNFTLQKYWVFKK
ncbi:GtrA family protein [Sphingobacterium composti Ten et al. 2007 non Yoo et al. 2007]|uniref:GtrA family protein n=1 Tax=Sphingobacterium composti TaxID=363260 RepID=UPI00135BA598|nr:GtrA family protein [Sphingobacterium composti Ten et al. 2007 non Yoo et al. 2007]